MAIALLALAAVLLTAAAYFEGKASRGHHRGGWQCEWCGHWTRGSRSCWFCGPPAAYERRPQGLVWQLIDKLRKGG